TMTFSLFLFTLFSLFCGLSITLPMLVGSRFIQGLVAGPIVPLSQSLLHKYGSVETHARDLSIWATIVITAPVLGPVLGGYISDWYHWPWIFYINIPVGIFCIAAIGSIMKSRESKTERLSPDYTGLILLSIGVSCLQILLDKGQQWDWLYSKSIWILLIGTILGFTYFILWERIAKSPFIDLNLLKIPSFTLSLICLIFSYAMYFGSVVVVPLWLQEYMNYNATWAGIAVCSLGIAPLLLSLITPIIMQKLGLLKTLMVSFFFFGAGCFYSAYFTLQVDLFHLSLARFIFGFGFVCYITPLFSISTQEIPLEKLPAATGLFHFVRAMMGGIGTSVFSTLWIRRTYFHHERIGEALTIYNPILPPQTGKSSLTLLNQSLDQQAALLAINDMFFLMGWLFLALIVLLIGWTIYRDRRFIVY
ncbi:MAG TPA: DHA2 family efflux MFS transporter permease subunit, partial [Chlamydiales bacterium]|nr:DHA2 family efflux MFS transporter permease subunit [Chlamydiales bacterium]